MYKVLATKTFERSLKKVPKEFSKDLLEDAINILETDPFNLTKKHKIKKLNNAGIGEWRIKLREYRIRYDVFGRDVVLHLIRHRKDIYKDL